MKNIAQTPDPSALRLDGDHCRAICDEIGERLRFSLDGDTEELPLRLLFLLGQFMKQEYGAASTIARTAAEISLESKRCAA